MQLAVTKDKITFRSASTAPYVALITAEGSRLPVLDSATRMTQYSAYGAARRVANPAIGATRQPNRMKLGELSMQLSQQLDLVANPKENIEAKIGGAFAEWMQGIGPISDTKKIVAHPAYKRIVSTGKEGIPVILRRLQREPSLLAWALFDITGENPVRAADYGKIDKITKAWLKWGKKKKFIQ